MGFTPRRPDYYLKIKVEGKKSGRVGAAWKNRDGSISIQLDPGVVLDWRLTLEGVVTLFLYDEKKELSEDAEEPES